MCLGISNSTGGHPTIETNGDCCAATLVVFTAQRHKHLSRCHVLPGLRRTACALRGKPAPNLQHRNRHRIVSYVTVTPLSKSNSSMSRKLSWKRKYQPTAQLMTPAGKRCLVKLSPISCAATK